MVIRTGEIIKTFMKSEWVIYITIFHFVVPKLALYYPITMLYPPKLSLSIITSEIGKFVRRFNMLVAINTFI